MRWPGSRAARLLAVAVVMVLGLAGWLVDTVVAPSSPNGPGVETITVSPGLAIFEVATAVGEVRGAGWAKLFSAAAVRAAAASPFHPSGSLEGLLGLGTYTIAPTESPTQLVAAMTGSFLSQAAADGVTPETTKDGLDAYQLIIAASITQKEGFYDRNMGRVARVILNRLAAGGPLQMDSTVLYHYKLDGGPVTAAMLRSKTRYNTYTHTGLTPTPICAPSNFALRSVMDPPAGQWLYFTLINEDGTMAFADTFAQQLANERYATAHGVT